jgi:formylmethanofuran dehydrogenase subunit E
MSFRTDDPHADFDRHERRKTEWLDSRPKCSDCNEPIQDEHAYYIHGEWICEECVEECRKAVN